MLQRVFRASTLEQETLGAIESHRKDFAAVHSPTTHLGRYNVFETVASDWLDGRYGALFDGLALATLSERFITR